MRKLLVVGVVAASLGLSACGVKASIDQAVSSLGTTADLQVHLTGSASGPGTASMEKVLNVVAVDLNYSNPSGAALSQAGDNADVEVVIDVAGQTLVDLRQVDQNVYAEIDLDALSNVPGANISASQVAAAQLLVGGRWFEIPKSLLDSYLSASGATGAQSAKDEALARTIIDEVTHVIETAKYTTLPSGGYSETGSLASIEEAVLPTIEGLTGSSAAPATVRGSYALTLTLSGSTATGGSVTITTPSGGGGRDQVSLTASAAHADDTVSAPSGATVITPALVKELEGSAVALPRQKATYSAASA